MFTQLRDTILKGEETEPKCGVLQKSEDREEILRKYFSMDIRFDEAIAGNKKLRNLRIHPL